MRDGQASIAGLVTRPVGAFSTMPICLSILFPPQQEHRHQGNKGCGFSCVLRTQNTKYLAHHRRQQMVRYSGVGTGNREKREQKELRQAQPGTQSCISPPWGSSDCMVGIHVPRGLLSIHDLCPHQGKAVWNSAGELERQGTHQL